MTNKMRRAVKEIEALKSAMGEKDNHIGNARDENQRLNDLVKNLNQQLVTERNSRKDSAPPGGGDPGGSKSSGSGHNRKTPKGGHDSDKEPGDIHIIYAPSPGDDPSSSSDEGPPDKDKKQIGRAHV